MDTSKMGLLSAALTAMTGSEIQISKISSGNTINSPTAMFNLAMKDSQPDNPMQHIENAENFYIADGKDLEMLNQHGEDFLIKELSKEKAMEMFEEEDEEATKEIQHIDESTQVFTTFFKNTAENTEQNFDYPIYICTHKGLWWDSSFPFFTSLGMIEKMISSDFRIEVYNQLHVFLPKNMLSTFKLSDLGQHSSNLSKQVKQTIEKIISCKRKLNGIADNYNERKFEDQKLLPHLNLGKYVNKIFVAFPNKKVVTFEQDPYASFYQIKEEVARIVGKQKKKELKKNIKRNLEENKELILINEMDGIKKKKDKIMKKEVERIGGIYQRRLFSNEMKRILEQTQHKMFQKEMDVFFGKNIEEIQKKKLKGIIEKNKEELLKDENWDELGYNSNQYVLCVFDIYSFRVRKCNNGIRELCHPAIGLVKQIHFEVKKENGNVERMYDLSNFQKASLRLMSQTNLNSSKNIGSLTPMRNTASSFHSSVSRKRTPKTPIRKRMDSISPLNQTINNCIHRDLETSEKREPSLRTTYVVSENEETGIKKVKASPHLLLQPRSPLFLKTYNISNRRNSKEIREQLISLCQNKIEEYKQKEEYLRTYSNIAYRHKRHQSRIHRWKTPARNNQTLPISPSPNTRHRITTSRRSLVEGSEVRVNLDDINDINKNQIWTSLQNSINPSQEQTISITLAKRDSTKEDSKVFELDYERIITLRTKGAKCKITVNIKIRFYDPRIESFEMEKVQRNCKIDQIMTYITNVTKEKGNILPKLNQVILYTDKKTGKIIQLLSAHSVEFYNMPQNSEILVKEVVEFKFIRRKQIFVSELEDRKVSDFIESMVKKKMLKKSDLNDLSLFCKNTEISKTATICEIKNLIKGKTMIAKVKRKVTLNLKNKRQYDFEFWDINLISELKEFFQECSGFIPEKQALFLETEGGILIEMYDKNPLYQYPVHVYHKLYLREVVTLTIIGRGKDRKEYPVKMNELLTVDHLAKEMAKLLKRDLFTSEKFSLKGQILDSSMKISSLIKFKDEKIQMVKLIDINIVRKNKRPLWIKIGAEEKFLLLQKRIEQKTGIVIPLQVFKIKTEIFKPSKDPAIRNLEIGSKIRNNDLIELFEIIEMIVKPMVETLGFDEGIKVICSENQTIREIKMELQKTGRFKADDIILVFAGKTLENDVSLSTYFIKANSIIYMLLSGTAENMFNINPDMIDSRYNYDYTDIRDDAPWERGGLPYYKPCGWMRIALKVDGLYDNGDDTWVSSEHIEGAWAVSYHGTDRNNLNSILKEGFKLDKCKRFLHGIGIYSTPHIEIAEEYGKIFLFNGNFYISVLQNRIDPKKLTKAKNGEYYICGEESLRPYAICIKSISKENATPSIRQSNT